MKIIKSLLPVLVLLVLSLFALNHYPALPQVLMAAVVFLPVLLSIVALALSAYFSRSHIFFYVLLITSVNIILGLELAGTRLAYAMMSGVVPLLIVVLTLLPDRGLLTLRSLPAHMILLSSLSVCLLLIYLEPVLIVTWLFEDWLPARYFDWSSQPQSVLYLSLAAMLTMMVNYSVRPTTSNAAGFGVLLMLILQMHFGSGDASLHVFTIFSLLICLYAILQESWRMAYLDELTELPARRALREKLQKVGGTYSVAMLDVDHFKKFNDTYGHDTGDAVLRMIAGRMRKVTGGGSPYRYGGEEFTVVFNSKDGEEATPYLEALRESIADTPFVVNRMSRRNSDNKAGGKGKNTKAKKVQVTISIGVADSTGSVLSPWDVLKQADKALYRAKKKGRNCLST